MSQVSLGPTVRCPGSLVGGIYLLSEC